MEKFSEKISGDCSVLKRKVTINRSRGGLKLSNISLGSRDKAKEERVTPRKQCLCDFYEKNSSIWREGIATVIPLSL
jgi:hypothetical protein